MSVFEKTSNRPQRYLWGCVVFKNVHTSADFLKLTSLWHGHNFDVHAVHIGHNGTAVLVVDTDISKT